VAGASAGRGRSGRIYPACLVRASETPRIRGVAVDADLIALALASLAALVALIVLIIVSLHTHQP